MAKTRFEIVAEVVQAELAKPYEYGTADCFFFGCRIADALNPELGLCEKYSGKYTSLLGAQKAILKEGFKSLSELFSAHLEPCAPAQATTGDLVILQLSDGEHVGVCAHTRFITKTEKGRSDHDLMAVKAAFRT